MADRKTEDYQDIIDLPHHISEKRPRMPMADRAAQFSPFAALTGYDAAVEETARLTDQRIELDEDERERILDRLAILQSCVDELPVVEITYFVPDERKAGGIYRTVTGIIKKLDEIHGLITMIDGAKIPIGEIIDVRGPMFRFVEDTFE